MEFKIQYVREYDNGRFWGTRVFRVDEKPVLMAYDADLWSNPLARAQEYCRGYAAGAGVKEFSIEVVDVDKDDTDIISPSRWGKKAIGG